jgi:hypothetical protein
LALVAPFFTLAFLGVPALVVFIALGAIAPMQGAQQFQPPGQPMHFSTDFT